MALDSQYGIGGFAEREPQEKRRLTRAEKQLRIAQDALNAIIDGKGRDPRQTAQDALNDMFGVL